MSVRRWLAPAAVWLALAACGDDAGRGIADEAAGPLAQRVAAVRAAAAEDRERALVELGVLREEVAAYADQGDLSDVAAERILTAADAVEAALAEPPAAAPTTTPPPTVTTTTAAPGDDASDEDPPADQEQRSDEAEAPDEQKKLQERQREEQKKLEEEQRKRDEEQREEEQGKQEEGNDDG